MNSGDGLIFLKNWKCKSNEKLGLVPSEGQEWGTSLGLSGLPLNGHVFLLSTSFCICSWCSGTCDSFELDDHPACGSCSYQLCAWMPATNNVRVQRFTLVHGFRGLSSWSWSHVPGQKNIMVAGTCNRREMLSYGIEEVKSDAGKTHK